MKSSRPDQRSRVGAKTKRGLMGNYSSGLNRSSGVFAADTVLENFENRAESIPTPKDENFPTRRGETAPAIWAIPSQEAWKKSFAPI
jgi:hypothetical protein